jgi:hypothetical protein
MSCDLNSFELFTFNPMVVGSTNSSEPFPHIPVLHGTGASCTMSEFEHRSEAMMAQGMEGTTVRNNPTRPTIFPKLDLNLPSDSMQQ